MSTNNITGDKLVSKPTQGYAEGYDLIWKRDKKLEQDICNTRLSSETRERRIPPCCGGEVQRGEEA